jgi:hypothetical protein
VGKQSQVAKEAASAAIMLVSVVAVLGPMFMIVGHRAQGTARIVRKLAPVDTTVPGKLCSEMRLKLSAS